MSSKIIEAAIQTIKEQRSSKNSLVRLGVSTLSVLWNAAQTTKHFCVDSDFRSILFLQLLNSKKVHQTTPRTYLDRYPVIFSACRDYFEEKQELKILSYGCSTGEEVLTLRRYFPNAQIIGTDINKRSLDICKKLPVDEKITFIYSKNNEIQKYGPFDAIFCMAVLQRKPHDIAAKGINSLKRIYPFEKFEQQIVEFDKLLNTEGLLVVHFTQYSLKDTKISSKYIALGNYNQNDYLSPVFDKNSNLIQNPNPINTIFIKKEK